MVKRVALLAAAVLASAVVEARNLNLERRALVLRIEGHVGAPRDGDRRVAELTLRRGDRIIPFQVEEIRVLSGDAAGTDVLHEVAAYEPSMSVAGPPVVVEKLEGADPNGRVAMIGYFRSGQRIFSLSSVERLK